MALASHPFPVYFARHGETVFNAQGRYQGGRDDSPLTERGRKHAADIAALFRSLIATTAAPSFISSPLGRATTTTQIILKELSLPKDAYTTDFRVREIDLGDWSGKVVESLKISDADNWNAREKDKWNIPVPGGESYEDVAHRATEWFNGLTAETVLISHGGIGRILRGLYENLTWQKMSGLDEPYATIFKLEGGTIARIGSVPSTKLR